MARQNHKSTFQVYERYLYTDGDAVQLDTPEWFAWLDEGHPFYLKRSGGQDIGVAFRAENRGKWGLYWYAVKRSDGKLHKKYAGRGEKLTLAKLLDVAAAIISG